MQHFNHITGNIGTSPTHSVHYYEQEGRTTKDWVTIIITHGEARLSRSDGTRALVQVPECYNKEILFNALAAGIKDPDLSALVKSFPELDKELNSRSIDND